MIRMELDRVYLLYDEQNKTEPYSFIITFNIAMLKTFKSIDNLK